MALKGDRQERFTDISFFMDQVAEKGGIVCIKTGGSGAALDQSAAEVEYAADPSGDCPVGLLVYDMVNVDLTKYTLNPYKMEVQKGSKVLLGTEGWYVTDMIATGVTIAAGNVAYVAESGLLTNTSGGGAYPEVGRWLSSVDADGFAKVYVKLPK
jgi:hypothetical protein